MTDRAERVGASRRDFLRGGLTAVATMAVASRVQGGATGLTETRECEAWIRSLRDSRGEVRLRAAWALGRLRLREPAVRVALVDALEDPDRDVRIHAAWALGQCEFTDPDVQRALQRCLADPSATVRMSAEQALSRIG